MSNDLQLLILIKLNYYYFTVTAILQLLMVKSRKIKGNDSVISS